MNFTLDVAIEKIQLAEVDPDKKYLIMVKVENDQYMDANHMANAGNYIIAAMERLGCSRENISVVFGYAMEIVSIAVDEGK